ncbi:hypothetical protein [Sphingomonas sp. KR3-1]|uniref:hypothetical protein n=1 Tax=Sphingomonas sp. KR3-1 TaxID=3156611 RepID=UPI0032B55722
MHSGTLSIGGIISLIGFMICWLVVVRLSERIRALATARHPLSFPAVEKITRTRPGRGSGARAFHPLRQDPEIGPLVRRMDLVRMLAFIAVLSFIVAAFVPGR